MRRWLPLALGLAAWAQAPTFRTDVRLVVETVTVRDRGGRPVHGLTAGHFTVTEDGVEQTIRLFEHQTLAGAAALPDPGRVAALPRLRYTQIGAGPQGTLRYRDRRLLALYFDLSTMPPPDQVRALEAARRFVRTQMTAADLVALLAYSDGAVQVLSDFTADRERLLATLETMIVGEDENAPPDPGDTSRADNGAAYGQNDAEFNIFFTDRQLAALQTAATMLGRLSEKKALLYFASGLRLNGTNNQAQLQATINAANRAGVSFWPVDARGLVATPPLGDATRGSAGGAALYTGAAAGAVTANLQRTQDTLWTLAADTGGQALLDNNDLAAGMVAAQKAVTDYYLIGYYTTNPAEDGRFRRVRVQLRRGVEGELDYRQGYYAPRDFHHFTAADKERQLEDALAAGDPVTELTMAVEVNYFQLNRAEYFVPVAVKIPGSELALARRGGAEHTRVDFIGEVRDRFGTTISNVRDKVDLKLSGATAAELARRPIEYDTGFTLLPGRYRLKMLARDAETGRMGTYEAAFTVPNLDREERRVALSSVVLGSQRMDPRLALYQAGGGKGQRAEAVNPLIEGGQKLMPSVTRVFSRTRPLHVFLQAYRPAGPVAAYVTLSRNGETAIETEPVTAAAAGSVRLPTAGWRFELQLGALAAGEYLCQVTVVDATGKKAAFWRTPIALAP
jgi:VWFA-related protein